MKTLAAAIAAIGIALASPAFAHEVKTATTTAAKQDVKRPKSETPVTKPKPTEHSGGTDARGCHTNHATGDYHCHTPK